MRSIWVTFNKEGIPHRLEDPNLATGDWDDVVLDTPQTYLLKVWLGSVL